MNKLRMALIAAASLLATPAPAQTPALGYSPDNMDRRISPRRDFVGYASGRWLQHTEIPASEPEIGGFKQLAANLDRQLLKLIQDAAAAPAPKGSPRQQVGDFWRAAMDVRRLDELGLKPLEADFRRLDSLDGPAALGALSGRLQKAYSASPLANLGFIPDMKDSRAWVLAIVPGIQTLGKEEYAKPEHQALRDLYVGTIARMFRESGDAPAAADGAARAILSIEAEIQAARLTPLEERDPAKTYNRMPLAEAQALVPALDIGAQLAALGIAPPAGVQVLDVAALRAVQRVLAGRPAAEVRSLLRWHIMTSRASALGRPWRDIDQGFSRQRAGLRESPTREREVTQVIGMQLFHPLSRLYVETYFPETTRREVTEMVGHIKQAFERCLKANRWLDAPTREAALAKLAKVDIQVGYPANWIDFSGIDIRPDDHFGNLARIAEFLYAREVARAAKPVEPERFANPPFTTPISVNAAYNPQTNGIDITAAIIQPPFYVHGADMAVNYCTMGAVIGHEITHGFDSFGRQFGPAGNLRDWWTPQAAAEFGKRTALLVEQYSVVEILPGLKHNGLQTLTENTADLGGITLAHEALHRALEGKPQPKVDGLTTDQRCFVAWSQMWAYKARPERLRQLVAIDYHSIGSLRAYAPLQNLDAFHKAFGVRPGDPMWRDPAKRAKIW